MMALTSRQLATLFVVSQQEPVSVRDVADGLLTTQSAARARLDALERRRMLDRHYTGTSHGRICYVLRAEGRTVLDAFDNTFPQTVHPTLTP
jgi:DNA-binding MarR family transcriptional regulator